MQVRHILPMRWVLAASGITNVLGAVTFLPSATGMRELAGLPSTSSPVYLSIISALVLVIGCACLMVAVRGQREQAFVLLVAAGKLTFVAVLAALWAAGHLPFAGVASGGPDLVLGVAILVLASRERSAGKPL